MKLSIIIKVEYLNEHVEDCIESIINQSIFDYEVFLISNINDNTSKKYLLNIVDNYSENIKIKLIFEKNEDINVLLNEVIKLVNGDYIHILTHNNIVQNNLYSSFFNLSEEFEYDLFVFDFFKIINTIDSYKLNNIINKKIINKNKQNNYNELYLKSLKEDDLRINFDTFKKTTPKNKFRIKGFKYLPTNINESLQEINLKYKKELLIKSDIYLSNNIIKKGFLCNNLCLFNGNIKTNSDIYKILPLIRSISILKDVYIFEYDDIDYKGYNSNNFLNTKININKIISQSKNAYNNILKNYKRNNDFYCEYIEVLEYKFFMDLFSFYNKQDKLLKDDNYKYIKEIYLYLTNLFPNYKNNKYFNNNISSKIKFNKNLKKINIYINQEYLNKTNNKYKNKTKIRNKNKNLNINISEIVKNDETKINTSDDKIKVNIKKESKSSIKAKIITKNKTKTKENKDKKKKTTIFRTKVRIRKIKFDINKILRTRVNVNFLKLIKQVKYNIIKLLNNIKKHIFKIFKINNNKKLLYFNTQETLLLNPGKIDTTKETNINKTINKNFKKPIPNTTLEKQK